MSMHISELSSGCLKSPVALENVQCVRNGATVQTGDQFNPKYFTAERNIQGRTIAKGMLVLASYNDANQGADLCEVLGFTGDDEKYGNGGVKFDSVKDLFTHYGVKSLWALEELQDEKEYGYASYMVVRDLDTGESGSWFYLYEGRWCRGSGAEPLSFTLMQKQ